MFGDALRKAVYLHAMMLCHGRRREAFKAGNQRLGKAGKPVAMRKDGIALSLIQRLPHLLRRVGEMIKVGNIRGDGTLKVDVVFPERVVSINEKGLALRIRIGHIFMITRAITRYADGDSVSEAFTSRAAQTRTSCAKSVGYLAASWAASCTAKFPSVEPSASPISTGRPVLVSVSWRSNALRLPPPRIVMRSNVRPVSDSR